MVEVVLIGLVVALGGGVGYLTYVVIQQRRQLDRVVEVLSRAGPGIAAQIREGSTKVVLNGFDWDEEIVSEDTVTR